MNRRLYNIWSCMRQRCNNPNNTAAPWYHDKGIRLCEEWEKDFTAFQSWATSNGYCDDLTIDRVDPDGNYCPENCRWISRSENSSRANKGKSKIGGNSSGRKKGITISDRSGITGNGHKKSASCTNSGHTNCEAMNGKVRKYMIVESIFISLNKLPEDVAISYLESIANSVEGFAEGFAAGKAHAAKEQKEEV